MNRAYSILTVKSFDEDERVIRGVATTPSPDRVGDIVEPLGVKFSNPMPLLWGHDHMKPVGTVRFDRPTKAGITFEARLPKVTEVGTLRDRIDEVWQAVKYGMVRGVSIGFRALDYSPIAGGGTRFTSSEVLELSLVAVPANQDASISTIKSLDQRHRGAAGGHRQVSLNENRLRLQKAKVSLYDTSPPKIITGWRVTIPMPGVVTLDPKAIAIGKERVRQREAVRVVSLKPLSRVVRLKI